MTHFRKKLKAAFGNPEFFFNKIFTVNGLRYHISVMDEKEKTIFFNMERKEGKWCVVNPSSVPAWIINLDNELSAVIAEHLIKEKDK